MNCRTALAALIATITVAGNAWSSDLAALEERAFKEAVTIAARGIVRINTIGGADTAGQITAGQVPTTGVVLTRDGYIMSSAFSFSGNPSSVLVELPDGTQHAAIRVATDHLRMLTLLRIEADNLEPLTAVVGDSVQVGQWAIAIGRSYDSSLPGIAVGLISAVNRIWGRAIQTDASVSPMNYGGPLVDIQGRAIGVLVPLSPNATEETAGVEWYDSGIGFAIPMGDVMRSFERLRSGEDLWPGLLGVTPQSTNLYSDAPVIDTIRIDSPAEKAGLASGDVVTRINDREVRNLADLKYALGNLYANETITIIANRDGAEISKSATLAKTLPPWEFGFLGILPTRQPRSNTESGVPIRHIYSDSPASLGDMQNGDRIVGLNDSPIATASDLEKQITRLRPGTKTTLSLMRNQQEVTVQIELRGMPTTVPAELTPAIIPPPVNDEGEQILNERDDPPDAPQDALVDGTRTGRIEADFPGHDHAYWAWVPEGYNPDYSYGLMVWIHPTGDTMEATMLKSWKSLCEQRGIIIVAPKAANARGWTANEAEFVRELVEFAAMTWSIDARRVFLHSWSTGTSFAFHLALKDRALYRGLACADGVPTGMFSIPQNDPALRLQFYFLGDGSDRSHDRVRALVSGLRKAAFPTVFTVTTGKRTTYPPAEFIEELGRWADSLDAY